MENKIVERYGKSEAGNFLAVDTIGVPHGYCITSKHVSYAADHCCGILSAHSIEEAEKHGAVCGVCKGELSYHDHKTGLLVRRVPSLPQSEEVKQRRLKDAQDKRARKKLKNIKYSK